MTEEKFYILNGFTHHLLFLQGSGELKVQAGKTVHTLSPRQTITAQPNIHHRFFNTSHKVCKFQEGYSAAVPRIERYLNSSFRSIAAGDG